MQVETIDRPSAALTPRRPGHWRNKFWVSDAVELQIIDPGVISLGNGEWIDTIQFPSAELAEQYALADIAKMPSGVKEHVKYRGAVHFPEGSDA